MTKGKKTVLLSLSCSLFDKDALKYAINISDRIGASLEILFVSRSGDDRQGLHDFRNEVDKVGFRFSLVPKEGCMKRAILDYTNQRSEIAFVVVGSETELGLGCEEDRSLDDDWKRLKCPLVVVSKSEEPSLM